MASNLQGLGFSQTFRGPEIIADKRQARAQQAQAERANAIALFTTALQQTEDAVTQARERGAPDVTPFVQAMAPALLRAAMAADGGGEGINTQLARGKLQGLLLQPSGEQALQAQAAEKRTLAQAQAEGTAAGTPPGPSLAERVAEARALEQARQSAKPLSSTDFVNFAKGSGEPVTVNLREPGAQEQIRSLQERGFARVGLSQESGELLTINRDGSIEIIRGPDLLNLAQSNEEKKQIADLTEQQIQTERFLKSAESLKRDVRNDPRALTSMSEFAKRLRGLGNELRTAATVAFGLKFEPGAIEKVLESSELAKLSAGNARLKTLFLGLAVGFAGATGLGQGRALTDKDLRLALESVGANTSDPIAVLAAITTAQEQVQEAFAIRFRTITGEQFGGFKDIAVTGSAPQFQDEPITDRQQAMEILRKALDRLGSEQ